MPSAARLVSAICLGALAWFVSGLIVPLLPEGTQIGRLYEINTLIGIFIGWTVMGSRVGRGSAIGNGVTGVAALVFWGLVAHSLIEMIRLSMRLRYDGPMEALTNSVELAIGYARMLAVPDVIGSLVVGALVIGWLTEQAGRRWS